LGGYLIDFILPLNCIFDGRTKLLCSGIFHIIFYLKDFLGMFLPNNFAKNGISINFEKCLFMPQLNWLFFLTKSGTEKFMSLDG